MGLTMPQNADSWLGEDPEDSWCRVLSLVTQAKHAPAESLGTGRSASRETKVDVSPGLGIGATHRKRSLALGIAAVPTTSQLETNLPPRMVENVVSTPRGPHLSIETQPGNDPSPGDRDGSDLVLGVLLGMDLDDRCPTRRVGPEKRENARRAGGPAGQAPYVEGDIGGAELGSVYLAILQEHSGKLIYPGEVVVEYHDIRGVAGLLIHQLLGAKGRGEAHYQTSKRQGRSRHNRFSEDDESGQGYPCGQQIVGL
jgi:hypothetical protein